MSQHAPSRTGPSLAGQALLSQLREGWKPLPLSTLLAMAMGGLRVRMMRSAVTMLSIILAIAFLAYTGLTSQLTLRLSQATRDLSAYQPIDPALVQQAVTRGLALDPIAGLEADQKRELAVLFGLDQIAGPLRRLPSVDTALRKKREEAQQKQAQLAALEADPKVAAADRLLARSGVEQVARELEAAEKEYQALTAQVALGQFVRGQTPEDPDRVQEDLNQALRRHARQQVRTIALPARFLEPQAAPLGDELPARIPLARQMIGRLEALGLPAEDVQNLHTALDQEELKRRATDLESRLRRTGIDPEKKIAGGDSIDTWLIVMALLTCAVGIANAMLMSVTERIREIGTMKCLGAQDNLVVKLFLLESGFLGVVGAVIGVVLGLLVALLAGVGQFGGFGLRYFPLDAAALVVLWSVLCGIVLAVLGAVYPAFAASRMKPVDALRVDE